MRSEIQGMSSALRHVSTGYENRFNLIQGQNQIQGMPSSAVALVPLGSNPAAVGRRTQLSVPTWSSSAASLVPLGSKPRGAVARVPGTRIERGHVCLIGLTSEVAQSKSKPPSRSRQTRRHLSEALKREAGQAEGIPGALQGTGPQVGSIMMRLQATQEVTSEVKNEVTSVATREASTEAASEATGEAIREATRGNSSEAAVEDTREESVESPEEDSTVCLLSGDVIEDPEKEAQLMQERIIKELANAQIVFPLLAFSRLLDALPGILDEHGNMYEEIVTVFSAVDPLIVGVFAYLTAANLQKMLDRERRKEETLEQMRKMAMESLVNFFERANLVVLGVAIASFSRLIVEEARKSDDWSAFESKLLDYAHEYLDAFEFSSALFSRVG